MTSTPEPSPLCIEDIAIKQDQMQATLDAILAKFDEVANEIKPLIDQLSNHPMAKMLGLKK